MRLPSILLLLASVALLHADVLETFQNAGKFAVHEAAKNGFILESAPENGGVRLRRNSAMPEVVQFSLRWTGKAYPAVPDGDGVCKLTLRHSGPRGFQAISLRMQDSKGEVFQFRPTGVRKNADGTVSCYWNVGDTGWETSWGKDADKKVDRPLGFFGFAVRFGDKEPETELTFLKLEYLRSDCAANAIRLDVDTGGSLFFLKPGEEEKFRIVLENQSGEPIGAGVELTLEDFFGNLVSETHELEFSSGERKLLPLRLKLPLRGHWEVTARLTGKDGEAVKRTSFLYANPAEVTPMRPKGEFLFGINSHLLWTPELYDRGLDYITASGAKLVREGIWWDRIQPRRDVWNFEISDRFVGDLQKRGLAHNWCLVPIPQWAAPPETRDKGYWVYSRSQPEKGTYETFAETLAHRYRGKVLFWEMWNEADLNHRFTADSYLEMLKEGYRGIKKGDPDAWVVTTGFASMVHPRAIPGFQQEVLRRGVGFYDIHAYHEHGGFEPYVRIINDRFLPMRRKLGVTAPWFANETAVTSAGGQERAQALTVFRKIMFAWAKGSVSYVWYNLRNKGNDPMDGEHNYGLLHHDFHPKSGYAVFHAMATLYTGLAFDGELAAGNGRSLFRFKDAERLVIGSWSEGESGIFAVRTDAKRAEQVDIMGNRREVPIRSGVTVLQVESIPSSLVLHGGSRAELGGELVRFDSGGAVPPGKKGMLTLTIANPWGEPLKTSAEFLWPDTVRNAPASRAMALKPGETGIWSLTFPTVPEFRDSRLRVRYEIGEYAGVLNIPLVSAIQLGAGPAENRAPDFVLNKAEQVFNRYQADPASTGRLWRGPEDLSAKIHLERQEEELHLKIEVTDDVHSQKNSGADVYLGDNIQAAFLFSGQDGSWEIGLTRRDDGTPECWVWTHPSGFDPARTAAAIRLKTERTGTVTRYDARIPFRTLGVEPARLESGFRFNLLVNDDDGEGRDGWISIAPGMGMTKDPGQYPMLLLPPGGERPSAKTGAGTSQSKATPSRIRPEESSFSAPRMPPCGTISW